jgi:hypothetical protein
MRAPGPARAGAMIATIVGLLLVPAACATPERRGEVTSVVAGPADTVLVTVVEGSTTTVWSVDHTGGIVAPAPPPVGVAAAGQACAGEVCYRVVAGRLAVERSGDAGATYLTDWDVTGAAYERLASEFPDLGDPAVHLASVALVVLPVAELAGHVVFVANGRDGLLHRTSGGRWQRLGVPTAAPTPHFAAPPPVRPGVGLAGQVATAAGGIVLLVAGWIIARRRTVRPARAAVAGAIAVTIAVTGYLASGLPDLGPIPAVAYASFIVVAATIGGTAMAVFILTAPEREPPPRGTPPDPEGGPRPAPGPSEPER